MYDGRNRWARSLGVAVFIAAAALACGEGGEETAPDEAAEAETASESEETEAARASMDACELLSPDAAERILGEPVGEPDQRFGDRSDCLYHAVDSDRGVAVKVSHPPLEYDELVQRNFQYTREEMGEEPRPVAGIGDTAFYAPSSGVVAITKKPMTVSAWTMGIQDEQEQIEVGKAVVSEVLR